MQVKDLLSVVKDTVDIHVGEDIYTYSTFGISGLFGSFYEKWEIRKSIGTVRTKKISEEEKNYVLDKEIQSIRSGSRAPIINVYTKL